MQFTCMGHVLARAKQLADRRFSKILSAHGIEAFNGAQGRILSVLWERDGQTLREIGRRTGLAATSLTSMIDRMEKAGLVSRAPDPCDRRTTHVFLSAEASTFKDAYNAAAEEMSDVFFAGFSDEERRTCEHLLLRAVDNLQRLEDA